MVAFQLEKEGDWDDKLKEISNRDIRPTLLPVQVYFKRGEEIRVHRKGGGRSGVVLQKAATDGLV